MSRKMNTLFGAAALVAGTAFLTSTVTGQPEGEHGMTPEQAQMMAAWEQCMTPGDEHQEMMKYAGKWDMVTRWWMDPNAPPRNRATR